MKHLVCTLPIATLLFLTGCGGGGIFGFSLPGGNGSGGSNPNQPVGTASLSGTVTDATTSLPLANARVVFGGNRTLTGDDGRFTFRNVSVVLRSSRVLGRNQDTGTRMISLSVALSQYDCIVLTVPFTSSALPDQAITLSPHGGSAAVSGLVRDAATRNAIVDATVIIGTGATAREARTDLEGSFLVSGLEPVRQQLSANAPGFVTHTRILENLSPGATFELTSPIDLLPAGTTVAVSGTIRDEDGNSISGATVRVGDVMTQTLGNGFYELSGISVGSQTFQVSAQGFLTASFTLEVTGSQGPVNVVLFRSGVNPPPGPFTVRGRVIVQGAPDNGGVKVSAIEQPGNIDRDSVISASDGKYQLFIPEGSYIIRAEKMGFQTQEQNVVVPPGGQVVDNVNFVLPPQ